MIQLKMVINMLPVSGNVFYNKKLVVVKIQYQMYDDGKIKFKAMTYNDIPQNAANTAAMFSYLKKEYLSKDKPIK